MARPKKETELKHSQHITLRLTDIEFELLTNAALETGLSRSGYLRRLLVEKPITVKYEIVADMEELKKLAAEFGKIGNNLNQIAKYFHTGGIHSMAVRNEIHECISQIFDMRKEISRLAGDYRGNFEAHCK